MLRKTMFTVLATVSLGNMLYAQERVAVSGNAVEQKESYVAQDTRPDQYSESSVEKKDDKKDVSTRSFTFGVLYSSTFVESGDEIPVNELAKDYDNLYQDSELAGFFLRYDLIALSIKERPLLGFSFQYDINTNFLPSMLYDGVDSFHSLQNAISVGALVFLNPYFALKAGVGYNNYLIIMKNGDTDSFGGGVEEITRISPKDYDEDDSDRESKKEKRVNAFHEGFLSVGADLDIPFSHQVGLKLSSELRHFFATNNPMYNGGGKFEALASIGLQVHLKPAHSR